jgi:hypothetical protein
MIANGTSGKAKLEKKSMNTEKEHVGLHQEMISHNSTPHRPCSDLYSGGQEGLFDPSAQDL